MLEFGSQSVEAHAVRDSIAIEGFGLADDGCLRVQAGGDDALRALEDALVPVVQDSDITVHAAVRITGDTSANVLGVATNADGSSVMDTLMAARPHARQWGVVLGTRHGLWVLGPPPTTPSCRLLSQRLARVPIDRPAAIAHAPTEFLMSRLVDVLVGTSLREMRSVLTAGHSAMHVLFDTGSTMTYASQSVRRGLRERGGVQGDDQDAAVVALRLENGVVLALDPAAYRRAHGFNSLDVTSSTFEDLLGKDVDGILLGCVAMAGIYMHVDLDAHELGFSTSNSAHMQLQKDA
jgi:hypothetical protein